MVGSGRSGYVRLRGRVGRLGINTPAIMATEASMPRWWAQDALAMYGYAAASDA
ncbi:hypothetical protein BVW01_23560, partial [Mycobacterium tuberculosis]